MNDDLKLEDKWTGAEGANDRGIPVMVRYRQNLQSFIDTGLYKNKIAITWAYDIDEAAQMPTPGEAEVMDKLETDLIQAMEEDRQSILATVKTGEGTKTWTWYSANAKEAEQRVNDVLEQFETLPIRINQADDPNWDEYYNFITEFGGAA